VPGARPRKKLAGILTEARTSPDLIRDLVIGIGVNVNHGPGDFPSAIADRATSLRILCGRMLERAVVAEAIMTALDDWYTLWTRDGEEPVLEAFRGMAQDLEGRRVRVEGGPEVWEGVTAGLGDDGGLRILRDGASHPIDVHYGDVLRIEEKA
jgi:BirA family transcriptional regulator, biotin operon repressor / biotin---[acetyl-CoA-carboxylase] ligase